MTTESGNGWGEYKREILYRLDQIDKRIEGLEGRMAKRAGIAGALTGSLPIIAAIVYFLVTGVPWVAK